MMAPERATRVPGRFFSFAVPLTPPSPRSNQLLTLEKLDDKPRVVNVLLPTGRLASDFSTLVPAE
jgi:hypothetical protein